MPKKNRLTRADFQSLSRAKRTSGDLFSLTYAPLADGEPRYGFVVSKKVALKAHDRNLIKRRCRMIIRSSGVKMSGKFIFTAKKGALAAKFSEIKKEVERLMRVIAH